MAFSDDEEDDLPQTVSNYYFEDDKEEPISISVLPIMWSERETVSGAKEQIFLRGTVDNGLLKTHKPVIGWKFDLSNVGKPEILVFTKEKVWVKVEKPRKSYEELCRSILITVHCLHCVRKNPNVSGKSLWDQLGRAFSSLEVKPSEKDLVDHRELISEVIKRNNSIAKSQFLSKFLEKPGKRKLSEKDVQRTKMSEFIVDDADSNGMDNDAEVEDSNEEDDLFDSVCSICDNGGELLCCEGRCLRSFHPSPDDGEESFCDSLGLTKKQVVAIENFFCENCKHEQHQCFVCGELGSSVKSSGAEVFCCANATCGRFYHPHCVAKWLHSEDEVAAKEHAEKIIAGEVFSCSIHKCFVCGLAERKKDPEMQFAVCRRCPKSYHRKCLPREIAFDDVEEEEIITRAWENLLPNRVLIYCLDHEIDEDIGTPARDHIKFPPIEEKKINVQRKKQVAAASEQPRSTGKIGLKNKNKGIDDSTRGKSAVGKAKQLSSAAKDSQNLKKGEKVIPGSGSLRKVKEAGLSRKFSKESSKSASRDVGSSVSKKTGPSLGAQLFDLILDTPDSDRNKTAAVKSPTTKKADGEVSLDAESERRISAIMEEAESSVTMDDIMEKYKDLTTLGYSTRSTVDKTITMGKVENSVQAVRTALEKLENGSNIDDATAICDPDILQQIFRWQNKLRVYLAPFLHGMRYTSFGRHFTKPDKLEVIVDRLHWYVKDGDTIVDTSCGSNDFSVLMKAKLEETGKKCSYKNYDIFPPKNDFNYEKRNWMDVQTKELPTGSQLIMGLNPPFGVRGVKGDQFIDKILEFRPKLVILIVPPESERLDEKKSKTSYELMWEDNQVSDGKAFYLPGSVDENDKQIEQWNKVAPPLRLWSRKDWADKHRAIAEKHGHVNIGKESRGVRSDKPTLDDHGDASHSKKLESEEPIDETVKTRQREEEKDGKVSEGKSKTPSTEVRSEKPRSSSSKPMDEKTSRASADSVPSKSIETEKRHVQSKNQSVESSRKRRRNSSAFACGWKSSRAPTDEEQLLEILAGSSGRGTAQRSPVVGQSNKRLRRNERRNNARCSSPLPVNRKDGRPSLERRPSKSPGNTQHFGKTSPLPKTRAAEVDHIAQRYSTNEPGIPRMSAEANYGERYTDYNLRSQSHPYAPHHPAAGTYMPGYEPGFSQAGSLSSPHGFGSLSEPSYQTNAPTMQRYAPRLDEMNPNPTRYGAVGSEPPVVGGYGGFYNPPRPPQQPGYNSMGFAPGPAPAPGPPPNQPYPLNYSPGWLNE